MSSDAHDALIVETAQDRWNATLDVTCLRHVQDTAFIVQEALVLHDKLAASSVQEKFATYRSVHWLAIERLVVQINNNLQSTVAAAAASQEKELNGNAPLTLLCQLQERLVALGTYELLCHYLMVPVCWDRFHVDFSRASPLQLAQSFARQQEFCAMTIVCVRHEHQICDYAFQLLEQVPANSPPVLYHYILPTCQSNCFVSIQNGCALLLETSKLSRYLKEELGLEVVLDAQDEQLVRELTNDVAFVVDNKAVEAWYADRIETMSASGCDLASWADFCRLGLMALNMNDFKTIRQCGRPIHKQMYQMLLFCQGLEQVTLDQPDFDVQESSLFCTLSLNALADMGVEDLVALVFDGEPDADDVYTRFHNILLPMATFLDNHNAERVDETIVAFGCDLIAQSTNETADNDRICSLLRAVRICSICTTLSRTSVDIRERIIKNKRPLIQFVECIFSDVTAAVVDLPLIELEYLVLVDSLWSLYESLPIQIVSPIREDARNDDDCHDMINEMYEALVLLEIVSQWPGCNAFRMLQEIDDVRLLELVVTDLCQSFYNQVRSSCATLLEACATLLAALLSDISELVRICFDESFEIKDLMAKHLFAPLIRGKHTQLIDQLLSTLDPAWIDMNVICGQLVSLINEVVYAEGDEETVHVALLLQDILTRHFPNAQCNVLEIRRSLDAARFINDVILSGTRSRRILPDEISKDFPMDVIDLILSDYPAAIISDCQEWKDTSWAAKANEHFRLYDQQTKNSMPVNEISLQLPVLPGRLLFHLSELLGLENTSGNIAIKCLLVRAGLVARLYGAAAAVCRTLFLDVNLASHHSNCVLLAVASIVTQNDYQDVVTKRELCLSALHLCQCELAIDDLVSFHQILDCLERSELSTKTTQVGEKGKVPRGLYIVERFVFDTLHEYNSNMYELLSTLRGHFSSCMVDDLLLNAISRFILFFCIAKATRPKHNEPSAMEEASLRLLVALSSSLMVHMTNEELAQSSLQELRAILEEQIVKSHKTVQSFKTPIPIKPDPATVRRLVDRGYSENGSRRAVIGSHNIGFEGAVQWAVTHSLDANFEEPIVILRDARTTFVDEDSSHRLRHVFDLTDKLLFQDVEVEILASMLGDLQLFASPSSKHFGSAEHDQFALKVSTHSEQDFFNTSISVSCSDSTEDTSNVNGNTFHESNQGRSSFLSDKAPTPTLISASRRDHPDSAEESLLYSERLSSGLDSLLAEAATIKSRYENQTETKLTVGSVEHPVEACLASNPAKVTVPALVEKRTAKTPAKSKAPFANESPLELALLASTETQPASPKKAESTATKHSELTTTNPTSLRPSSTDSKALSTTTSDKIITEERCESHHVADNLLLPNAFDSNRTSAEKKANGMPITPVVASATEILASFGTKAPLTVTQSNATTTTTSVAKALDSSTEDDRRRLIERGRLLLVKARETSGVKMTPARSPTSTHRYPLRSQLKIPEHNSSFNVVTQSPVSRIANGNSRTEETCAIGSDEPEPCQEHEIRAKDDENGGEGWDFDDEPDDGLVSSSDDNGWDFDEF